MSKPKRDDNTENRQILTGSIRKKQDSQDSLRDLNDMSRAEGEGFSPPYQEESLKDAKVREHKEKERTSKVKNK